MELLDNNNSLIDLKLVEDGEKKEIENFIGYSELEEAFGEDNYIIDGNNNQLLILNMNISIRKVCNFFIKRGIFISFLDIEDEYNIIFENCHISQSYGNALLGDGSVEGGIIVNPCNSPNTYWRGF